MYLNRTHRRAGRASLAAWIGPIVFVMICVNCVSQRSGRWEFDDSGLPRSRLAKDGVHYQDGTLADPLTRWLVRSGHEQDFYILALSFIVVGVCATAAICRDTARKKRRLLTLQLASAELDRRRRLRNGS